MRLSAVTNLTLVVSVALIACTNTEGTPGQTASSGSPNDTSSEGAESSKGGSGAGKTSAKTSGGSKAVASSKAKGGTSSTTDEGEEPQQEGGSGNEPSTTKPSSSKTGGAGGTGGSKSGSNSKGGATGSGSTRTSSANGGTGARTTGNTTAKGGTSATTTSATTQQSNVTVPRLTNGQPGKTTRYWDCCKPSCGWSANAQSGGKSNPANSCGQDGVTILDKDAKNKCWDNGPAFQCYSGAPWEVSPTLAYGYAAFNGGQCGKCYQLDFSGDLNGKTMIVQAVNIGTLDATAHFDLLIPGGGVGAAGEGACKAQWNNANLGATNGGFRATCGTDANCIKNMCQAAFGSNTLMMDSCTWYTGWFKSADNPNMVYAEVPCPAEITNRSGLR